jgi:DNA repair protein RecN (Recombination protein N)
VLEHLEIRDLALIAHTGLDLGRGFQVITGETGVGKSLLLGAIEAISGKTVSKDLVRTGEETALVEGVFTDVRPYFEDNPEVLSYLEEDDMLIISREIRRNGRNICRLNGRMVPLSFIQQIGDRLCDIHGQNDRQQIFLRDKHLGILDRYGRDLIGPAKKDYNRVYRAWQELKRKEREILIDPEERRLYMERLEYQINEILDINPEPGEDETLRQKRDLLRNTENITEGLEQVLAYMDGSEESPGLRDLLGLSRSQIQHLTLYFDGLEEDLNRLIETEELLDEVRRSLEKIQDRIDRDPQALAQVEDRLDKIHRLKLKYGGSIEEVRKYLDKARANLERTKEAGLLASTLEENKAKVLALLEEKAQALYEKRLEVAAELEENVMAELNELGMEGAEFKVRFKRLDLEEAKDYGLDQVEFMLSANKGEALKPLADTASGGEASRIMLAIKVTLAEADDTPLLVFDEIDTGISGRTTEIVGRKLEELGRTHQIICVSHQAQIAARADRHFYIFKESDDQRTRTHINLLKEEERSGEIARLLSGRSDDAKSLSLAQDMLKSRD